MKDFTFYLLPFTFYLFLTSCATVGYKREIIPPVSSRYIPLDEFCKNYNLEYEFDTLDDIIQLSSNQYDLRLILNSSLIYFNGNILELKHYPFYRQGLIYLPKELGNIIEKKKDLSFLPPYLLKTIVIDPGHGGKDPGAVSRSGLKEKVINLKVSRYLKKELEKRGFKVILTRSRDVYLSLKRRVEIAKRYDADLFISIHTNSSHSRSLKGAEVYYLSPYSSDILQRALSLSKQDSNPYPHLEEETRTILWDLRLSKNHSLSVKLANYLYYTFKNMGFKIRPPRQARFYVLKFAYTPAILVEIGYLSNRYEEKILRKKYYQKQIAEAIALGVVELNKKR